MLLRGLVDGEALSVGGDCPGRSFVRVGDLGPKDKLGLLRRVFGAAHDSVDPGERERVDLIAQGGASTGFGLNSFILIGLFAAVRDSRKALEKLCAGGAPTRLRDSCRGPVLKAPFHVDARPSAPGQALASRLHRAMPPYALHQDPERV